MNSYRQHGGIAVRDNRFSHVMALTLDPRTHEEGAIRCIKSREGDVAVAGFVDRSALYRVRGKGERYEITEPLSIRNEKSVVEQLNTDNLDYLGLEDPDIWTDEQGLMHLYFTMPFISKDKSRQHSRIHLGHAVGSSLDSLEMTAPVLEAPRDFYPDARAKEVSIAPLNVAGFRYNLFEGHDRDKENEETYSTVRVAKALDMGSVWEFGPTAFHPKEHRIPWIGGHASPGPLLPRSFIDMGEHKLLGILNGREANRYENSKTVYGIFSVGLFLYDYEKGVIEWVSPQPLIRDSEARTITFASQFVPTGDGEGVLYAHVDDSFVRAYTLYTEGLRELLP